MNCLLLIVEKVTARYPVRFGVVDFGYEGSHLVYGLVRDQAVIIGFQIACLVLTLVLAWINNDGFDGSLH